MSNKLSNLKFTPLPSLHMELYPRRVVDSVFCYNWTINKKHYTYIVFLGYWYAVIRINVVEFIANPSIYRYIYIYIYNIVYVNSCK